VKVSFFETVRSLPPQALPPEWPVPAGAYDPEAGARAYRGMIERLAYVYDAGGAIAAERPEAFAEVVGDFLECHEAFVISRAGSVIHP
jgi:hypothetical protein